MAGQNGNNKNMHCKPIALALDEHNKKILRKKYVDGDFEKREMSCPWNKFTRAIKKLFSLDQKAPF